MGKLGLAARRRRENEGAASHTREALRGVKVRRWHRYSLQGLALNANDRLAEPAGRATCGPNATH